MLIAAIGCAVAAALCYAVANHLQHASVRKVTSGPVLSVSGARAMLRVASWRWSVLFLVAGAALHVVSLMFAPLTVVQPIGVLNLVVTAVLAKVRPSAGVLAAMTLVVGGVGVFIVLSAVTPPTGATPDLAVTQWVPVAAVLLALAARAAGVRTRCVLLACAGAVLFGFTSALVRVLAEGQAGGLLPLVLAEIVLAAAAGGWFVHQAHAAGSSAVVVGTTTIIDPLVAVLIGVFAYGEGSGSLLTAGALPAAAAIVGLVVLTRSVPDAPPASRSGRRDGPLRIVVAADTYPPDINGASHFAHGLAAGLAARGHEVHVLCPATTKHDLTETAEGVVVHRIGARRTPFHPTFRVCAPWRVAKSVPALLAAIEPDLVHSQAHFVVGRHAVRVTAAAGVPVVATNHFMPENLLGYGPLPRWSHRLFVRVAWWDLARVLKNASAVTAPTPRAVQLLGQNGVKAAATAISCGVDRDHFASAGTVTAGAPVILFVGRLDAEKNVHELLQAFASLPAGLGARVELVGDGSERDRLAELATRLGVADRVTLRGFVTDEELVRAYQSCAVFCMPGTAELQSLATMEAMAAGRPVVAADAMALPHLVRPGHNGWLYRPGDVAGLSRTLADVLSDRSVRDAMGRASAELIAGHDVEETLTRFEQLYRRVIEGTTASVAPPDLVAT
ncbi:glycosyltransferase family 4 protein [Amycolatopsis bartoniae]|uniref:Glucosyltransferase n=2 Tax=Amycolatopsis bartoniae TaxID=941986 RepID=A0A8H9J1C7_9PSEU|nr:glycosyltransferase family 4 protein [Amycolatopsis bartoniae]GHF83925.1 glucosyltransferase [Amycolatopsis bartoniae]